VIITANLAGVSQTTQLNLVRLVSVAVNPNNIGPGQSTTGTLTLSGAVPTAAVVNIATTNPTLVKVPQTVTIPANTPTVNFPVNTAQVAGEISARVNINATLSGVTVTNILIVFRLG
jgi:hypothetical protein